MRLSQSMQSDCTTLAEKQENPMNSDKSFDNSTYADQIRMDKGGFFDPRGLQIPVAVSAFPDEIYQAPKSWTEKAYPKLIYYNRLPKGGHFAAWEQPELFSEEMRAAFRSLR
jgi:pimeloyl-ACP methyl ester carboxylesterase